MHVWSYCDVIVIKHTELHIVIHYRNSSLHTFTNLDISVLYITILLLMAIPHSTTIIPNIFGIINYLRPAPISIYHPHYTHWIHLVHQ